MIRKAIGKTIPPHLRKLARENPGEMYLLPTGAKVVWHKNGYWVSSYAGDQRDILPYILPYIGGLS